jgi:hypothetical protein
MNTSPFRPNRNSFVSLAFALTLFGLAGICNGAGVLPAATVLTRDGNDLVVTLNDPVIFITTASVSGSSYGFLMPNAINTSGTGGFPISLPLGANLLGRSPSTALIRGGATLEILYFGGINLPAGATVPLFPGVLRLPSFFNYSVIQGIRTSEIPLVVLSNSTGQARSAPTAAVPEPTTAFFLVGAGTLAFARRRRRFRE